MSKPESRLNKFKNQGRDFENWKKRNIESSFELRKQKKDDQVFKRRNISLQEDTEIFTNKTNASHKNSLNEIIYKINIGNYNEQFCAVQSIRKMLSREINPPITEVINTNLVHRLVKLLENSENPNFQYEVACVLTNIASGTSLQTKHVVESGAVIQFIKLLSSSNSSVCEQVVWALGNIVGDGSELRDLVIKCGIVDPLLALIQPNLPITFLRNITWTLSNLCRYNNPSPSILVLNKIIPALSSLLFSNDIDVIKDTCWALSYITHGRNEIIDAVITMGKSLFNILF